MYTEIEVARSGFAFMIYTIRTTQVPGFHFLICKTNENLRDHRQMNVNGWKNDERRKIHFIER